MTIFGRLFTISLLSLVPATALAQKQDEPKLVSPWGFSVAVGGGVTGFLDSDTRHLASTGGSWEARATAGTREWVGVEAAYIGTAQSIDALGLDTNAVLLGSGVEAVARVNFMRGPIQPYVLAGGGWTRYDITNAKTNTSDIKDSDNTFDVPMGLGVSYRYQRLILDARAVVRPVFDNQLTAKTSTGQDTRLDNISGLVHAGFEF